MYNNPFDTYHFNYKSGNNNTGDKGFEVPNKKVDSIDSDYKNHTKKKNKRTNLCFI